MADFRMLGMTTARRDLAPLVEQAESSRVGSETETDIGPQGSETLLYKREHTHHYLPVRSTPL